jgi:DNA invertase Pin-like site-specific DNA recombinase
MIACEYVDTNVSGAGGPGPRLQALIEELPALAVSVVAVTGLGRLSRSQRTLTEVLAAIEERGVRILVLEPR